MSELEHLEKGDLLLIQDEIYRLIGDYREVETPLNFEIQHIENENDTVMLTTAQMRDNLKAQNWKIINMDSINQ